MLPIVVLFVLLIVAVLFLPHVQSLRMHVSLKLHASLKLHVSPSSFSPSQSGEVVGTHSVGATNSSLGSGYLALVFPRLFFFFFFPSAM